MVVYFESTFIATTGRLLIMVFVPVVLCDWKSGLIFIESFSMLLSYNMVNIKLYFLSITSITQLGEYELYIPMV